MPWDTETRPCLRFVEAVPITDEDGRSAIGLRDASGLSDVALTVSPAALELLALMDGNRDLEEIRSAFQASTGQAVSRDTLDTMLDHLEAARLLEGDGFEAYYRSLVDAYQAAPSRPMRDAEALGVTSDGAMFDAMLGEVDAPRIGAVLRGIVAPHLDYARGAPCYGLSYGALAGRVAPDRVVILGTNHFGRSTSVVATTAAFSTPLGTTACDRGLIEALEGQLGTLRTFEFDHAREHSIELQVAWLQHLWGAEHFEIVPFLCPDPCGPTGTAPCDGRGADLERFARTLGELVAADDRDTLIVAGADLSHVGRAFGDQRPLDAEYLSCVRQRDEAALDTYIGEGPEAFRTVVARDGNATRVCSTGCMYALATALEGAAGMTLGYHQAVDQATQTCVTCASVTFC